MSRTNHTTSGRVVHEDRVRAAKVRISYAETMSPTERIAALDERLGKGVGATKERARLAAKQVK